MGKLFSVFLWNFLLVLHAFSPVECGSSSANSQSLRLSTLENETSGKGTGLKGGVPLVANSISHGMRDQSLTQRDSKKPILSNDLHSTTFTFNAVDDEGLSYNDEEEDDNDSYTYDSFEEHIDNPEDEEFIKEHEKQDHQLFERPVIGKCCPVGFGLDITGVCRKLKPEHVYNDDKYWFPEKVYDDATSSLVKTNISEWDIITPTKTDCLEGERIDVVKDMHLFTVLSDGSLFIHHHKKLIFPLEFCLDQELGKGSGRVVRACFTKEELCDDKKCVKKCCPPGSFSQDATLKCKISHLANNYSLGTQNVLYADPVCKNGARIEPLDPLNYNITENGTLQTPEYSVPFDKYCIDYFIEGSKASPDGSHHHHMQPTLKALMCFADIGDINKQGLIVLPEGVGVAFGIVMIISSICLAIAAIISWRLPELRSLHGKCQLSHLITMFCLYVCLAIAHLSTQSVPQGLCTFLGVFIHICSLSSFLWLNLLCVNIYLTFRSLRPPLAARRDENRRLIFLCIYAWGIPAAFCLFLYALDSEPGRLEPMPYPEYGKLKCLISNRQAEFAYLFGPVGVLLLCNGLLFCLTAQELLCGVWRLDNSDSINFRRKSMGIVVAKLGIVMGMGWILDVVSWAVGNESPYMFYAADLFNSFQGVLISVILLWRKRVLEVLHLRRPSITKDETLTNRPFLPKNSNINIISNGDHDTSLVIVQEQ